VQTPPDVLKDASELGLDEFIETRLLEKKQKELEAREAKVQRLERELAAQTMALKEEKKRVQTQREYQLRVQQELLHIQQIAPLSHGIPENPAAPQASLETANTAPDDATQQTILHPNVVTPPKQQGGAAIEPSASQHLELPDKQSRLPLKGGGGTGWRRVRRGMQVCNTVAQAGDFSQDSQLGVAKDQLGQASPMRSTATMGEETTEDRRNGDQGDPQEDILQGQQQLHSKSMPENTASAQVFETADDALSQHTTDSHKTSDSNALSAKRGSGPEVRREKIHEARLPCVGRMWE